MWRTAIGACIRQISLVQDAHADTLARYPADMEEIMGGAGDKLEKEDEH
ncbi:MAG: hypothetical protein ABSG92_06290 [Conexivisphaerales archaeon]